MAHAAPRRAERGRTAGVKHRGQAVARKAALASSLYAGHGWCRDRHSLEVRMSASPRGPWLLLLALLALPTPSMAAEPSVVGTWALVSYTQQAPGAAPVKIWGEKPTGYLTYLPDGHMFIVLGAEKRSPAGAGAEGQARRAKLLDGLTAYAGTYTVEGDKIVHRVEVAWLPEWEGTKQPRWFKLEGDRLSVRTQPIRDAEDGKEYVYTLEYRRAPAPQGTRAKSP
jgi:hypothetical protein